MQHSPAWNSGQELQLVKIGLVLPKMRTDKHAHTEKDTLVTILRSPVGGGVIDIQHGSKK